MEYALFETAGPFTTLPVCPWKPDNGDPDFTTWWERESARRIADGKPSPADTHHAAQIAGWRARQASGDIEVRLDQYGEYLIRLADGTPVTVVFEPYWITLGDMVQIEFHGEISETGYRSSIIGRNELPDRDEDLLPWFVECANEMRGQVIGEWQRRNAAPKRKRRKKVAA